jgi:hypothetical protein
MGVTVGRAVFVGGVSIAGGVAVKMREAGVGDEQDERNKRKEVRRKRAMVCLGMVFLTK